MLNSSINERENQYQKLIDFTKEIDHEIIKITSALNWTIESIKNAVNIMLISYK